MTEIQLMSHEAEMLELKTKTKTQKLEFGPNSEFGITAAQEIEQVFQWKKLVKSHSITVCHCAL